MLAALRFVTGLAMGSEWSTGVAMVAETWPDRARPKGAGLLDMIKSPNRLKQPEYRAPGSDQWQPISWDEAITKIARLMKDDRDANFVVKNDKGELVNRWITTGFLASSAASNESGYLTHKVVRSLGMAAIDTQARI